MCAFVFDFTITRLTYNQNKNIEKEECLCFLPTFQRDNDREHKVRLAIGNGVRAEIWKEFLNRFGNIYVREFYASTEGNVGLTNYTGKIGAVGRVNYLHRVRTDS